MLSAEERAKQERLRAEAEARAAAATADNLALRGLTAMMDNTLETRNTEDDALFEGIERPAVLDVPAEEQTDEQRAAVKEYEAKVKKWEAEREKRAKGLLTELAKQRALASALQAEMVQYRRCESKRCETRAAEVGSAEAERVRMAAWVVALEATMRASMLELESEREIHAVQLRQETALKVRALEADAGEKLQHAKKSIAANDELLRAELIRSKQLIEQVNEKVATLERAADASEQASRTQVSRESLTRVSRSPLLLLLGAEERARRSRRSRTSRSCRGLGWSGCRTRRASI